MRGGNLPLDRPDTRRSKEGRDSGENELVFRLLCPSDKIGSVIGKGGSIIYNLRKETGARIKIANAVPGSDERVIIVSAYEVQPFLVIVEHTRWYASPRMTFQTSNDIIC